VEPRFHDTQCIDETSSRSRAVRSSCDACLVAQLTRRYRSSLSAPTNALIVVSLAELYSARQVSHVSADRQQAADVCNNESSRCIAVEAVVGGERKSAVATEHGRLAQLAMVRWVLMARISSAPFHRRC